MKREVSGKRKGDKQPLDSRLAALEAENSQLKRNIAKLEGVSQYDQLTGLPNQNECQGRLRRSIARHEREEKGVCVLYVAIDRFRTINDTLGNTLGDALIQKAAERILTSLRETDTLARPGRNEFIVLLESIGTRIDAQLVIDRIIKSFANPLDIGSQSLTVNLNLGASIYPEFSRHPNELLSQAYSALTETKNAKLNRCNFYQSGSSGDEFNEFLSESRLRAAFEKDEFYLLYQPQIEPHQKTIIGFEALLRWKHQNALNLGTEQVIQTIEKLGLSEVLTEWTLNSACKQLCAWNSTGLEGIRVAVNLSTRQLHQDALIDTVDRAIKAYGISPQTLEIELTEESMSSNLAQSRAILLQLKELGVQLAIDDFGTGYSSLHYLRDFPVDRLKIDREYTQKIGDCGNNAKIIKAVIELGKDLGLSVLAEGVEENHQYDFLRDARCDELQGYLFGRPQQASSFTSTDCFVPS